MGLQYQAAFIKAPNFRTTAFDGSANTVSNVMYFTCVATAKCNEVPEIFHGKYVRLTPLGANMWFAFTDKATHTIDRTIAATDAGAQAEGLGDYVANGEHEHVFCPTPPPGGKVYFSRQGDAAGTVYMREAADR